MRSNTKEALLEKGAELFTQKGFHHTGLQEILQSSGIPKGSFYHHFKSKEDFCRQVIRRYMAQSFEILGEVLQDHSLPPLTRLRRFFEMGAEDLAASGFRGCLLGNLSQELGSVCAEFDACLRMGWQAMTSLLSPCLSEAQEQQQIAPHIQPGRLANFLINSWQGALLRAKICKSTEPLSLFTDLVFGQILTKPA